MTEEIKEITSADIRAAVAKAIATGNTLHVSGYQSSKGAMYDYTLKVPDNGHEFYLDLVRDSVRDLTEGKITRPLEIEPALWKEACAQQLISWNNTLIGNQAKRESHEKLNVIDGALVRDDGVVVLTNCEIINVHCLDEVKSAVNSKPLTLAKKKLAAMSPLSKLSPRLNLSPDKVHSVWVDET
jgi:hypothetical protein